MTGRVVLFGATGYTGRLAAEVMTRAGLAPVLAGRSTDALVDLTGDVAGLGPIDAPPTWQRADVTDPASVRALVTSRADVLVSTVGPFTRLGRPALEAAIDQGCGYVDATGESTFIRSLFETDGPRAAQTGARLLTAFGYDFVPGNLAAALAVRDARQAGRAPVVIEVGYFVRGPMSVSSGTRATAALLATAPALSVRSGTVVEGRAGVATFDVGGRRLDAMPIGGSELFTIPRLDPAIRDVGVYLGWAGHLTRATHAAGTVISATTRIPGVGPLVRAGFARAAGSATGQGPAPDERSGSTTIAVARTLDGVGRELSAVRVEGPSPYDLTAELLAWGAAMLLTGRTEATGALGPADAFGLAAFEQGCADLGLRRVD